MGSEENPFTVLLSHSWVFLRLHLQSSALDSSSSLNTAGEIEAKRAQLTDHPAENTVDLEHDLVSLGKFII